MAFQEVGSVALKTTSWFVLPTLWISIFFLCCMIVYDGYRCVESHSGSPLVEGTLFSVVSSDHKISYLIDSQNFDDSYISIRQSFKGFFNWLFERAWFWIQTFSYIWWIYIFGLLLYYLINFIGGDMMPMFNKILFVVLVFAILQFGVGLLHYSYVNNGVLCQGSPSECLSIQLSHSIPFEGVFKLGNVLINRELFNNVHHLSQNKYVAIVSGVPYES